MDVYNFLFQFKFEFRFQFPEALFYFITAMSSMQGLVFWYAFHKHYFEANNIWNEDIFMLN